MSCLPVFLIFQCLMCCVHIIVVYVDVHVTVLLYYCIIHFYCRLYVVSIARAIGPLELSYVNHVKYMK